MDSRGRGIDGANAEIVSPGFTCAESLFFGTGCHADDLIRAEKPSRLGIGYVFCVSKGSSLAIMVSSGM